MTAHPSRGSAFAAGYCCFPCGTAMNSNASCGSVCAALMLPALVCKSWAGNAACALDAECFRTSSLISQPVAALAAAMQVHWRCLRPPQGGRSAAGQKSCADDFVPNGQTAFRALKPSLLEHCMLCRSCGLSACTLKLSRCYLSYA